MGIETRPFDGTSPEMKKFFPAREQNERKREKAKEQARLAQEMDRLTQIKAAGPEVDLSDELGGKSEASEADKKTEKKAA